MEGMLIASSNRGRYAVQDAEQGSYLDLTSGMPCEVWLGGNWVAGTIEHGALYIIRDLSSTASRGYYFVDTIGERCGLCLGMKVRLP
jgi:hypothetical protein